MITPLQLAGRKLAASEALLPAATTTVTPAATASLIAACCDGDEAQLPEPPRLMLITLAGVALAGTLGTARPAAQRMASLMSLVVPPHLPSTRTAWTLTSQFTPATPVALSVAPTPTVPATWVPCQLFGRAGCGKPHSLAAIASPGSVGSASRPSPSLAMKVLLIMSKPATRFPEPAMSAWAGRMPVSITATTTERSPMVVSQASGRPIPPGDSPAPVPLLK